MNEADRDAIYKLELSSKGSSIILIAGSLLTPWRLRMISILIIASVTCISGLFINDSETSVYLLFPLTHRKINLHLN
jgi:branched-subunit amino acid permease